MKARKKFVNSQITFDELRNKVGPKRARRILREYCESVGNPDFG